MTEVTSKRLHEETGAVLDMVKRGQRVRVIRNGKPDAVIVPANEKVDPFWGEIMAEVWGAAKKSGAERALARPNPILEERRKRNFALRIRRNARLR
jgi:prevent-host-death family protein